MKVDLKNKIDSKKIEILDKFQELSDLYRQDPECKNKFDYDYIDQVLELAKQPDTDIQTDVFGLISEALISVVNLCVGNNPKA